MSSGTLGVFRLADSDAGLATSVNNLYTCISGSWAATNTDVVTAPTTCVCAYSPYNASYGDATQLPLTAWMGLTTETSSHDLLYALPTKASSVSGGVSNTSFSLNHACTMLRFTLSGLSSITGTNLVNSFSIYNKNLPASASANITGGSISYSITKQSTSQMTCIVNKLLSDNPVIDVLLPPCTLYDTSNTTLDGTITVDGTDRKISLNLAANNIGGVLAAGTIYPVNIKLDVGQQQTESNCYILAPGATIYIPVSRASTANSSNFSTTDAFTTGLLWSDVSDTHVTATPVRRYIKVVAGSVEGNSIIYAKNANGDIVWSWHIWVTDYNPSVTNVNYNDNIWMDRNLGAKTNGTSSTAYGLYYQWGRKDPFPGGVGGTVSATYGVAPVTLGAAPVALATAIQHPNILYMVNKSSYYDWLTPQNGALWYNSGKTVYDPCPVGWRVPFPADFGKDAFPSNTQAGKWEFSSFSTIFGHWWSNGACNTIDSYGFNCGGSTGYMSNAWRMFGYTVRCVRE